MQVLERTKGGDAPGGGILEVVAWQPNFLRRASESAQEGDKPSVCFVLHTECRVLKYFLFLQESKKYFSMPCEKNLGVGLVYGALCVFCLFNQQGLEIKQLGNVDE